MIKNENAKSINRFLEPNIQFFPQALNEIKNGKKKVIGFGLFFLK